MKRLWSLPATALAVAAVSGSAQPAYPDDLCWYFDVQTLQWYQAICIPYLLPQVCQQLPTLPPAICEQAGPPVNTAQQQVCELIGKVDALGEATGVPVPTSITVGDNKVTVVCQPPPPPPPPK